MFFRILPMIVPRWSIPQNNGFRKGKTMRPPILNKSSKSVAASAWWEKLDLNQRRPKPTDLQSAPFDRTQAFSRAGARSETRTHKPSTGTGSLTRRVFRFRHSCIWYAFGDLNSGPPHYKYGVLPTELKAQIGALCGVRTRGLRFKRPLLFRLS